MATIRNPIEWSGAQFVSAAHAAQAMGRSVDHMLDTAHSPAPAIRKIGTADIWQSLRQGFFDFEAYRSDVLFLCATYAVIGLVLARIAFGSDLLPLLFPLASGFAILGPLAAVGLYEMSRRREQGAEVGWANAFDVIKAPAIGGIAAMGAILVATFLAHSVHDKLSRRAAPELEDLHKVTALLDQVIDAIVHGFGRPS